MEPSDLNHALQNGVETHVKAEDVVRLGKLILQFSRVERMTYHEDGLRKETDSDHTVMLGIIACALAKEFRPELDIGLIAQYALIHDLVEVYAGDTVTIGMPEAEKQEKNKREAEAFEKIKSEFSFSWLTDSIESYEALDSVEARFVKGVDKLMPKVTHILNNGKVIKELGITKAGLNNIYDQEDADLSRYLSDLPEIMSLRTELSEIFKAMMFPDKTPDTTI